MIVVPALEIRGGRVVHPVAANPAGDADSSTTDPREAALRLEALGAVRLHVVDRDALLGEKPQFETIAALIGAVRIPVGVSGGLRVLENAMRLRDNGADRLVFATSAVAARGVVPEAVRLWPGQVAVAVVARNGRATIGGWRESTWVDAASLAEHLAAMGIARIHCAGVRVEGAHAVADLDAVLALARAGGLSVTLAGPIADLAELRRMSAQRAPEVDEVAVGRAMMEGRFTLAEAVLAAGASQAAV